MRMADNHDPEPVVKVNVLVAVDVPDATALSMVDEHGLRRCVLEGARHAARDVLGCLLPQLARTRTSCTEVGFLAGGQRCDPFRIDVTQARAHRPGPPVASPDAKFY